MSIMRLLILVLGIGAVLLVFGGLIIAFIMGLFTGTFPTIQSIPLENIPFLLLGIIGIFAIAYILITSD